MKNDPAKDQAFLNAHRRAEQTGNPADHQAEVKAFWAARNEVGPPSTSSSKVHAANLIRKARDDSSHER